MQLLTDFSINYSPPSVPPLVCAPDDCPECGSGSLDKRDHCFSGVEYQELYECAACDAQWWEVYKFVKIEIVRERQEQHAQS